MSWADFTAKILDIANSRGHEFVLKATTSKPEADKIDVGYAVPVEAGPDGYVNKHGQRYEI